MSDFDPATNGHKPAKALETPPPRWKGVLMVAVVSALTGVNLMLGAGVGLLLAQPIGLEGDPAGVVMLIGAGLGGILGVIFGVRVAHRFGGAGDGRQARLLAIVAGLAGLVGAVAVSASRVPLGSIIAVMLPGLGAWIGDRVAGRAGSTPSGHDA